MRRHADPAFRPLRWGVALLLAALVMGACDAGAGPSGPAATGGAPLAASPAAIASATPSAPRPTSSALSSPVATDPADPSLAPASSPGPGASPVQAGTAELAPGLLAVTLPDGLRVRSQPRVATDSLELNPVLPKGTQVVVLDGPVEASDSTWFQVAPLGITLRGGVDAGWVAMAAHDGTPWLAATTDPTPGYELASVRVDRAQPVAARARAAALAQNAFGIALYRRLLRTPGLDLEGRGIAVSPSSVAAALAMARAGARGTTATEMDAVLRVPGWDRLAANLASLDGLLASRDGTWTGGDGRQHWLALRTANMAFAQRDYAIERAYLERLATVFGAGLGTVDYAADADAAREAINGWVARQTLGRIPALLDAANVTPATRLILVNAIYLKAEWALPFDVEATAARAFTKAGGTVVRVPTMTQLGGQAIPLATGDGWRATELRYAGDGNTRPLAMTLVLPDDMAAFERRLSPDLLATVGARIAAERKRQATVATTDEDACGEYAYEVKLFLPRFGVETRAELSTTLAAMGMPTAFADDADFRGITGADRLHIGFVIHQANIDVDEAGTTAAAATAVGMDTSGCSGPSPRTTKALRFDRPFFYAISDVGTGAILFLGRVVDPTKR